jgi:hypothetical protein
MSIPRLLLGIPSISPSTDSRLASAQSARIDQLERELVHLLDRIEELEGELFRRSTDAEVRAKFDSESA